LKYIAQQKAMIKLSKLNSLNTIIENKLKINKKFTVVRKKIVEDTAL